MRGFLCLRHDYDRWFGPFKGLNIIFTISATFLIDEDRAQWSLASIALALLALMLVIILLLLALVVVHFP
jgi:hypothetical protein